MNDKKITGIVPVLKVSGFPIKNFKEWDLSCKANFGDVRWSKMWFDHKISENYVSLSKRIDFLEDVVNDLLGQINELKKPKKEEEDKVKTFGSVKGNDGKE